MDEMEIFPSLAAKLQDFNQGGNGLRLTLNESSRPPDTAVLNLSGHADNSNAGVLLTLLHKLLTEDTQVKILILNMEALNYISSTGLGTLSHLLIKSHEMKISLRLCAIPEKILSVFHLLGFTRFFAIYPTVEAALSAEPGS